MIRSCRFFTITLLLCSVVLLSASAQAATPKVFLITGGIDAAPIKALLEQWQMTVTTHDLAAGPIPSTVLFDHLKNLTIVAVKAKQTLTFDDQNMLLDYLSTQGNALFVGPTFLEDHDNTDFLNYWLLTKVTGPVTLASAMTLKPRVTESWPGLALPAGTVRACEPTDSQAQPIWQLPGLESATAGFALRGKT